MIDFTIFYKHKYPKSEAFEEEYDVLLSAYDESERVQFLFDKLKAKDKHWLMLPEYEFAPSFRPLGPPGARVFHYDEAHESVFMHEFFDRTRVNPALVKLCVDITGFMRPHIAFLMRYLMSCGVRSVDVYYSEPAQYADREHTTFATGEMLGVPRPIAGFEGTHEPESPDVDSYNNDLLIVGTGYEHRLIKEIAEYKKHARKVQIFGFPSLQPDFYQENVLNAALASESVGPDAEHSPWFAPASDPFVTASVLQEIVKVERERTGFRNLYMSPLATRPQALGFAIYYMYECIGQPVSMIYPFPKRYRRATARGTARIWRYVVEFPVAEAPHAV